MWVQVCFYNRIVERKFNDQEEIYRNCNINLVSPFLLRTIHVIIILCSKISTVYLWSF